MVGDYAVTNREAEARAFADLFGGKERFEDLRKVFDRDADACIFDLDRRRVFALPSHANVRTPPSGIASIALVGKGDYGLLDLAAVGLDQGEFRICF